MKTLNEVRAGFIGSGAMGSALIRAASRAIDRERVFITSRSGESAALLASELGVTKAADNACLAALCDVVFLVVKPPQLPGVLMEIAPYCGGKVIVPAAAGVTLAAARAALGGARPAALLRIMPNIAASVGAGMTALAVEEDAPGSAAPGSTAPETEAAAALVSEILSPGSIVERVSEALMDCVTAVSGSGPAYGFVFIEALADAAVSLGMPRKKAYTFAAQTLKGAASLVLESGKHPAELKDAVCSPAGATVKALRALEAGGFRSTVIEAVLAAARPS